MSDRRMRLDCVERVTFEVQESLHEPQTLRQTLRLIFPQTLKQTPDEKRLEASSAQSTSRKVA